MTWLVALPVLFIALVADVSFTAVFEVGGTTPQLIVIVIAFVAMQADARIVRWYALIAGLLLDLSEPSLSGPFAPLYLIGPSTLGTLFAAEVVLLLRGILIRRNPLAVGFASFMLGLASGLFSTAWWAIRSWYPDSPPPWGEGSALQEFAREGLTAIATGILGIPLGWLLLKFTDMWSFPAVLARQKQQGGSARIIR